MRLTSNLGGIAIILAAGSVAMASPWSDSVVVALTQENQHALTVLLESGISRGKAATDFSDVAAGLQGKPGGKRSFTHFSLSFEDRLVLDYEDSSFDFYKKKLVDIAVPVEARTFMLRTMVLSRHKLSAAFEDSISVVLKCLLRRDEPSKQLKVMALRYMGHVPTEGGCAPFISFMGSPEPALREAAYQGLGKKILVNRVAGYRNRNVLIFDEIKQLTNDEIDQEQVKIFALFGEEYSRNYLLSKCSGDPEKIRIVFHFDTRIEHLGLIKEAVRLMRTNAQDPAMGEAIVHGIGEPERAVLALLGGIDSEVEMGLQLLKLFPGNVPRHEPAVRLHLGSQNQGIRRAAEALTVFLSSSKAEEEH